MKQRDIGLISSETMMAIGLIVVALVGYTMYSRMMLEPFKCNGNGNGNGNLMFNGSYPCAPVACLAGNGKIPCTAFSSG
jgi:hypothetical protein